uniref:BTB domain-containing protein n=1 Tax=Panagrolaimus davidi TaxID=227884 RepID=A0A914R542_9BILA
MIQLITDFYVSVAPQESAIDDSRPESVIPSQILSNETTLLHKIRSNNRYADVYFLTSNGEKFSAHRNILAAYSDIFVQIFDESSENPVEIHVNDFAVDTIQSALDFLYDKTDSINEKEKEVFKFAVKFGIQHLIDACVSFFKDSVNPTNVCEFIQIAYSNNFNELKQKCLQILVQKKEEIDPTKMAKLPSNILFDAFFFKM